MFAHIFSYRLRCLLRDKETIFWTMLFPIILATFFNMAFSNLNNQEAFKSIDIAVVDDAGYQNNHSFKTALEGASTGSDKLFNLQAVQKDKAEQLLADNKVKGYITVASDIKLTVANSGISESIIKSFIDSYSQTSSALNTIISENPQNAQSVLKDISSRKEYTKEVSGTAAAPNNVLNYFYSLIAMACLYGSFLGNREVTDIQANLSTLGARVNIAPVHKLKAFIYSMSAALLISFTELLLLLAYLHFGLKIDFGSKTGLVIFTAFIGCLTGITFGAFVSSLVKKGEGIKIAIQLGVTMTGSFLAGMMYQNMKYIVQKNVPILSFLNPVNLVTDAFYCLYYYDGLTRYAYNIASLCGFIVIFSMGTYLMIRRRKYASL
jgi:ABC-type multidrug transport system, permease component